jgi:hypothetical protein
LPNSRGLRGERPRSKRAGDAHFRISRAVALRLLDVAPAMATRVDRTTDQIVRGLSLANQRRAVLARNLANAATPGYRAQDLRFEDHLRSVARYHSALVELLISRFAAMKQAISGRV